MSPICRRRSRRRSPRARAPSRPRRARSTRRSRRSPSQRTRRSARRPATGSPTSRRRSRPSPRPAPRWSRPKRTRGPLETRRPRRPPPPCARGSTGCRGQPEHRRGPVRHPGLFLRRHRRLRGGRRPGLLGEPAPRASALRALQRRRADRDGYHHHHRRLEPAARRQLHGRPRRLLHEPHGQRPGATSRGSP